MGIEDSAPRSVGIPTSMVEGTNSDFRDVDTKERLLQVAQQMRVRLREFDTIVQARDIANLGAGVIEQISTKVPNSRVSGEQIESDWIKKMIHDAGLSGETVNTVLKFLGHDMRNKTSGIVGFFSLALNKGIMTDADINRWNQYYLTADAIISRLASKEEVSKELQEPITAERIFEILDLVSQKLLGNPVLKVSVDDTANDFVFMGHEGTLYNAVWNMVSNVREKKAKIGATKVVLSAHVDADTLIMCVEDDGKGFSISDLPHAFEEGFYKNEVADGGNHSGLGLANLDTLVSSMGGQAVIESVDSSLNDDCLYKFSPNIEGADRVQRISLNDDVGTLKKGTKFTFTFPKYTKKDLV
jgi:signal transduction histidine kinase